MMSVSGGMSAGAASSYFQKEDYYLKGQEAAEWIGKGAESLGLQGQVQKEDFRAVANGQDPRSGEQLVAPKITEDKETGEKKEEHRAGNDLTFSAPKSVSVAYAAGVEGIKEAHDNAVKAVAAYIQEHYSQHRSPEGIQQAGNLVAAKFDHVTSRALDPQLHSHLFVANMVQDNASNWKANEPLNIFKDQKIIGQLYRQELSNQLQQQRHELQYTNREQQLFEIKAVDQQLIDKFSQRREAIEKQVEAWKTSGEHKNVSEAKLYEMAALETRSAKDHSITKEDVRQQWDNGFRDAGTSAGQVKEAIETARQTELNHGAAPQKTAAEVVKDAAEYLTDKEAVMDRAALMHASAKISGGQHSLEDLTKAVDSTSETGVIRMGAEKGREFYTTESMKALEARNLESVKELSNTFQSITSKEEVNAWLDKIEKEEGVKPSDGQRQHIINELTGQHGVAVTQGDPGTGKTFASGLVERFNKEVLNTSGRDHYTINVAFTGKAAAEMSAASGKQAYTIDSFLNAYHKGKLDIAPAQQVHQQDKQQMQQAEQIAVAGEQHAEAMTQNLSQQIIAREGKSNDHLEPWERERPKQQWTTPTERNGEKNVLMRYGNTAVRHGKDGTTTNFEARHGNITTKVMHSKDGTRSHSISHSSKWSATSPTSYNKSGTVSRRDGSKVSWQEFGYRAGQFTQSRRIERTADAVRITDTKVMGNMMPGGGRVEGVSRTIWADGRVESTRYSGELHPSKGLQVNESQTKVYHDQKLVERHFKQGKGKQEKPEKSSVSFGAYKTEHPKKQEREPAERQASSEQKSADSKEPNTPKEKESLNVPKGSQVVLKVDEASFVGARQGGHLLKVVNDLQSNGVQVKIAIIKDEKQMQTIQAGPFSRHAHELAQEGKADFAPLKEINRQKDAELREIATNLNREDRPLSENAKEAIQALDKRGAVREVQDRKELMQAATNRYMQLSNNPSNKAEKAAAGEKASVMMITATNADRKELNQNIRDARIQAGEVQQGRSYEVLTPAKQGITAGSYKSGQVVQFSGYRGDDGKMHAWGARLQQQGEVVGINEKNNTVQVRYQIERDGNIKNVTKDLPADTMATKTTVYNREERDFSVGDRIGFGKNDKTLGVQNGSNGTILSLDEHGSMQVRLDNGKEVSFNMADYKNVDHSYAVTTEKSQGGTVEHSVMVDSGSGQASYNSLNVAVTRAEYGAEIITTDKETLVKSVQEVDEKTSTLDHQYHDKDSGEPKAVKEQENDRQETRTLNFVEGKGAEQVRDSGENLTRAINAFSRSESKDTGEKRENPNKTDELSRAVNSYAEEGKTSKGPGKEQDSPQKQSEHKQERESAKDNDRGVEM